MGFLRNGYVAGLCLLFLPFNIAAVDIAELSLARELPGLPDCAVSYASTFLPRNRLSISSPSFGTKLGIILLGLGSMCGWCRRQLHLRIIRYQLYMRR